ncbi:phosphoglucosamine mutase [Segniliparus rugosus]|uniref:Phosphoglucosamine mutase n=1 Tax=Segniliparus rugosus (strain ATCC BAA-974 / DSM 45345 / CCUG 50838 / CIP 108380 / JCM 13579 / CDC 945) TaxID=679197 RepID=E5XQJ0_SEGRC|nr:phosphoglucosamine mutase [Segniliparus rugosus]EFV13388.1 phosphoglucosamine mutase [Segniliparus rugosus ATCC BAA-974]
MTALFGTDGVRGVANTDLTPELALTLGFTAGLRLRGDSGTAVVGRDPRISGAMLEAAVCAGLASAGVRVLRVGVLPTPAVSWLTKELGADLGVVISASHNPMPDNGLKFFGPGGGKLDTETETLLSADVLRVRKGGKASWGWGEGERPTGAGVGDLVEFPDGAARYATRFAPLTPRAERLRVVVDCANGATSRLAAQVYEATGAEVIMLNAEPDGLNINDRCGSTHLDGLRAAVLEEGADLGLAHDGDGDRCLAVAADGDVVDGDAIMAILALGLHERQQLRHSKLVVTVMSNLGLHVAMREAGIELEVTPVGDRHVTDALREGGYSIGGEQSGHVVLPDLGETGDGMVVGLRLIARMVETGKSLSELASVVQVYPQVLVNVPVVDKLAAASDGTVLAAVAAAQARLGDKGRVLLRPSGTEQLVRVMVEAESALSAHEVAEQVAHLVRATNLK